ncbi:MAG TPA: GNAT family N-acetyltransferase [Clostridia bacterium]|nr:GNAT family N-acetyltransferase [Clostridia bacterium]
MINDISVRPYKPQDWPRIEQIHDAARKHELRLAGLDDAFVPLEQAAVSEGLFDYTVCVACLNDMVVGFSAYSLDELAWLYVDPAYMRCGVGSALVRHVVHHTKRPLELEVLTGNDPALRLYETCGFRQIRTQSGKMPGNESFHVTVHVLKYEEA